MKIQPLIPLFATIWVGLVTNSTFAQTVPASTRIPITDNTLGTQVTGSNDSTITGGLQRGQNLFHSFQDFSVPTGGSATFINPVGNQSIVTRVTGNLFSNIDGLVNSQGANFFLINPNGIVFGANAQLNVGQTFVGSTANAIDFKDAGGNSYRFGINGNDAPLLTINPNTLLTPTQLSMGGGNGEIRTLGTISNPGGYIGLIGGDVTIDGGRINAVGGRVEVGGLSAAGTVELGSEGNSFRVQFPTNVMRSDVALMNGGRIYVPGNGGGDINITARNIDLSGGSSLASGIATGAGTPTTVAGDIKLNATGEVRFSNSIIINLVGPNASGTGGNIAIDAGSISFEGVDYGLLAGTFGQGNGGNIAVNARDGSVSLQDGAIIQSITSRVGKAGNITVTAKDNVLLSAANIFNTVSTGAVGNGGDITIDATAISIQDGASVTAATSGIGNAGNVTIVAKDAVSLVGINNSLGFFSSISSNVQQGAEGRGGNIDIQAGSLSLQDGAQLIAATFGTGDAGNVRITTKGVVSLVGINTFFGLPSGISSFVSSSATGRGGNIDIQAGSLSLQDGGTLSSATVGTGDAGNIRITAKEAVSVVGVNTFFGSPSEISTNVDLGAAGNGGNIDIQAGSLSLQDGASITASTSGIGNAGNVRVKAKDAVTIGGVDKLSGFYSDLSSNVSESADGRGGNIDIQAGSLSLRDGASVTASTFGTGNAGNVRIAATNFVTISGMSGLSVFSQSKTGTAGDILVASPRVTLDNESLINARSTNGNGGNINIGGISPDAANLLTLRRGSKISTSSTGTVEPGGNGGNITINIPNGFIVTAPNENSDITANAFGGSGGKVTINSQQNFWITPLSRAELEQQLGTTDPNQLNPSNLPSNNITAISQVNPNLSGQVNITRPEIDITIGLAPLPNNIADPSDRINPNCSPKSIGNNSFTNVGRGGIPPSPKDPLNEEKIAVNWVRLNPTDSLPITPIDANIAQLSKPIFEAQGWMRDRNGDIILVAQSRSGVTIHPSQPALGCIDK
jgi:filamentous hemagglutinin family protein